jgi:hypothetical protein
LRIKEQETRLIFQEHDDGEVTGCKLHFMTYPPESGIVDEQGDRGLKTFRNVQDSLYLKVVHSLQRAALGLGKCCLLCGIQWLMQECAVTSTLMTPSHLNAMIQTLCNYMYASPSRVCSSPRPLHSYYWETTLYIYNTN